MTRTDLIKLLLTERDYHASHPVDIASKFWYTLGGTVTTVIAGLVFKDQIGILKTCIDRYECALLIVLLLIAIGYSLIVWAIFEHTRIHKFQLNRLEQAIEDLCRDKSDDVKDTFWSQQEHILFATNRPKDSHVRLFTKEPDTRTGWYFHDRKIEAGILFLLMGVILLIVCLLKST